MKILAFDTCNSIASASIIIDEEIISYKLEAEPSKQAERLIHIIEYCLREANLTFKDLDAIAVTNGPGSFTGVRIGLSAAKGFKLVTKLPLIDVTCLEALAFNYKDSNKEVIIVMDARRDQLYFQNFLGTKPINLPSLITHEQAYNKIKTNDFVLVGEGAKFLEEQLRYAGKNFEIYNPILDASLVAKAAKIKFENKSFAQEVEPLYIREAVNVYSQQT